VVAGAIPGQARNGADFNFGYQPINGNYPTASPGSYQVANGDTLQSIAQGAYGDSALWYRIADANGLAGNSDLRTGQTLSIPNRVGTVHNSGVNSAVGAAGTFKPYDPSKVQGDTTPNLPAPQAEEDDCGGFGQILVIIVAIVVTVVTYGADSPNLSAPPESYPPPFRQSSQWARWCCR
jgi:LysM domain